MNKFLKETIACSLINNYINNAQYHSCQTAKSRFFYYFLLNNVEKNLATSEHNRIKDTAKNALNFFFSFIHKHINNKCIYIFFKQQNVTVEIEKKLLSSKFCIKLQ